jgi:hypothetical protein
MYDTYLSRWLEKNLIEENLKNPGIREYLESIGSLAIRSAYARMKTREKYTQ